MIVDCHCLRIAQYDIDTAVAEAWRSSGSTSVEYSCEAGIGEAVVAYSTILNFKSVDSMIVMAYPKSIACSSLDLGILN